MGSGGCERYNESTVQRCDGATLRRRHAVKTRRCDAVLTFRRIQAAARPYAQRTRDFAERKPVLFVRYVFYGDSTLLPGPDVHGMPVLTPATQTYLAVFIALSFVPIACFMWVSHLGSSRTSMSLVNQ